MKKTIFSVIILFLVSCGTPSGHFKKQRSPSDIKISAMDIAKEQITIRFEYRSYLSKTLESISCDLLIDNNNITLSKQPGIKFESFAIERLRFNEVKGLNEILSEKGKLPYEIKCKANYDKGDEFVVKKSVLYPSPGSKTQYR